MNPAHWLAVEGVQPSIPQNPTTAEARASELVPKGPGANPALAAMAGNDNPTIKPQVKHVVSKELILFFDKIRAAILDPDNDNDVINLRKSALESVHSDPGLHQLVPYFVQFVNEKVTHSMKGTFVLRQMMELTAAVIANKTLFVDPYIASLVPPILTCLLGRNLGPDNADDENVKEQYQLRDLAASLIGQLSHRYSKSNSELQARLCRTCLKYFLDPARSLGENYGAIVGIMAVGGPAAISSLVLPNLKAYEYVITKAQNERGQNDASVRMLLAGILKAVTSISATEARLLNGANGAHGDEALEVEAFLGSIIGGRVAGLGNSGLNKAILEVRDKQ